MNFQILNSYRYLYFYTENEANLSQVNFVILSQDENLFESSINLLGSSIFVLLSQVDFLLELSKKYTWLKYIFFLSQIEILCLSQAYFIFDSSKLSFLLK